MQRINSLGIYYKHAESLQDEKDSLLTRKIKHEMQFSTVFFLL